MVDRGDMPSVTRSGLTRQLGRVFANTILAYVWFGVALAGLLVVGSRLAPTVLGDFGVRDAWVYLMLWLVVAVPLTVGFVLVVDLALRFVPGRRRASIALCSAPGIALAFVSLFVPELRPIAAFLLTAGAMLGATLRLPEPHLRRSNGEG